MERTRGEIGLNNLRRSAASRLAFEVRRQTFPFLIRKIILFGSVAFCKDDAYSDIDIAVILGCTTHQMSPPNRMRVERTLDTVAVMVNREKFGTYDVRPFHFLILSENEYLNNGAYSETVAAIRDQGTDI